MDKTKSDRFTSMKKGQPSKVNKFSSSGVGNFMPNQQKPPFSPQLLATRQPSSNIRHELIQNNNNSADEIQLEETNEQFYEFDLHLNNHEQFQEEQIEENIEVDLSNDKRNLISNNIKMRLQQKHNQAIADSTQIPESKHVDAAAITQPKFGTQIVNYQPTFIEKSESSDEDREGSRERVISMGKRTFQGKNFANLQESTAKKVNFQDQKENQNHSNIKVISHY